MITSLRLQHFRSYTDQSFDFNAAVNIIVGPNASGKTNLLEAILVVSQGSSYRVRDTELVSFGATWSRLDAKLTDHDQRIWKLQTEPVLNKQYELSGKIFKRLSHNHTLPVVLFEPNHLQLLSGGPERRRNYLDELLEQTVAGYKTVRLQYRRSLAQRNNLLKQTNRVDQTQLFPWNVRLSQLGGQIVRARVALVERIKNQLTDIYGELSHSPKQVTITYNNRWVAEMYETQMLQKLETDLQLDMLRGFTAAGPHREDMTIWFDDYTATETASRGETRSAILALKIIELNIIEQTRDQKPILLLDDVFSELDSERRQALTSYVTNYQTFITTTDADVIKKSLGDHSTIVPLTV